MDTGKLEKLFYDLLDVPADAREEAAVRLSGGDSELARRALALAAADEKACAANRLTQQKAVEPRMFGNYRTASLLGSGGMGSVYLAERADGQFQQKVALKILAPYAAGDSFRQRFLIERQILADLSHSNITRLIDGGFTEEGSPYLVMEYVEGVPLDRYCDEHRLNVRERLELFRKVCEPVAYAHRNLIVHRDLKPSNILITNAGEPMLLDFGMAKLLAGGDANATGTLPLLTLRYSSPEQRSRSTVTTATDVFSLGVILYELLTGAWPFGDPSSPEQMLQRFARETPMVPPGQFKSALAGDLTSILRKALDPEPERRYDSVQAFSADIENYLTGRPVSARQPSWLYRAGKFLRRHSIPTVAASIFLLGLVTATWVAVRQSRIAQAEARKAQKVSDFLSGMLASAGNASYDPKKFTVAQMLDAAEPLLATSWKDDPAVEAKLRLDMGASYTVVQNWNQAKAEYERSLALSRATGDRIGEARALYGLATNNSTQGATAASEPAYRAALDAVNRLGKDAPPDLAAQVRMGLAYPLNEYLYKDRDYADRLNTEAIDILEHQTALDTPQLITDRANSYFIRGRILMEKGRNQDAETALNQSIDIFRRSNNRSVFSAQPVYSLMMIHNRAGNYVKAKEYARQWHEILQDTIGPDHMLTAASTIVWARLKAETGETAHAADEALAAMLVVRKHCPPLAACLWTPLDSVSHILNLAKRYPEAMRTAREEIQVCDVEHLAEDDPRRATSVFELGKALAGQGQIQEAKTTMERALKIFSGRGPTWAGSADRVRKTLQGCCAR